MMRLHCGEGALKQGLSKGTSHSPIDGLRKDGQAVLPLGLAILSRNGPAGVRCLLVGGV